MANANEGQWIIIIFLLLSTAHCYQRHILDIDQDYVQEPEEELPETVLQQEEEGEDRVGWGGGDGGGG